MSGIFFCGNFCSVENKNQNEIEIPSSVRSKSNSKRNSRLIRLEKASENKEYMVDYFLYKNEKESDVNHKRSPKGSYTDSLKNSEANSNFKEKSESIRKVITIE